MLFFSIFKGGGHLKFRHKLTGSWERNKCDWIMIFVAAAVPVLDECHVGSSIILMAQNLRDYVTMDRAGLGLS